MNRSASFSAAVILLGATALTTGCYIKSSKDKNGDDKDVSIRTPVGGLEVHQNQTGAADMGLAAYPGAVVVADHDGDKSADVQMGFGKWQLKVKAVNYQSSDPQDKILAFYRKALARYGDVIECNGDRPAGAPDHTRDGLTCSDAKGKGVNINLSDEKGDFSLKAGSKMHQHIVGIKSSSSAGTNFALVQVDLPSGLTELGHSGSNEDDDKSQ
jgi:hypothetical protein